MNIVLNDELYLKLLDKLAIEEKDSVTGFIDFYSNNNNKEWVHSLNSHDPFDKQIRLIIIVRFVQEFVQDKFLLDLISSFSIDEIDFIDDFSNYIIIEQILKTQYKHLYENINY